MNENDIKRAVDEAQHGSPDDATNLRLVAPGVVEVKMPSGDIRYYNGTKTGDVIKLNRTSSGGFKRVPDNKMREYFANQSNKKWNQATYNPKPPADPADPDTKMIVVGPGVVQVSSKAGTTLVYGTEVNGVVTPTYNPDGSLKKLTPEEERAFHEKRSTMNIAANPPLTAEQQQKIDVEKGTKTEDTSNKSAAESVKEITDGLKKEGDGSSATIEKSDELLKSIADEINGAFERQEDLLLGVPYEYLSGSQAEDIESAAANISNTEYDVDTISKIGFEKHPDRKAFMYITGPAGKLLHGEFILDHMGIGTQERSSIQETFAGNFMQVFGSRQKTLSISGGVYDAENFEWAVKLEQLYDSRIKASSALRNGEKIYLYINKRVIECYILSFQMTYSAQEDSMARFNMTIFVKSVKYDYEHDFASEKPKKETPPRKLEVTFAGNSTKIESKLKNFPDMIGNYDARIRGSVSEAQASVSRRMSKAFTKYGGKV